MELEEMETDEGALFLLRRANLIAPDAPLDAASEDHKKSAREITEEVAGLPLALDQAAAYIEETPSTPAKYLKLYRTGGAALRAQRGNLATDHDSVTITFSLAFAQVEKANPAAADLVRVCAFLAPDAIPEEIFTQGGKQLGQPLAQAAGNPLGWDAAVEAAGRFRLIHRNVANDTLNIHRLVQEVLKDGMDPPTRRVWAERVVQALNGAYPYAEFQNWPQCERLIPHAIVAGRLAEKFWLDSVAAARLLNQSGYYLVDRARYAEAEPLCRRALAICEKALGPDHFYTAASLNNLAGLYYHQGLYTEAESLYQRTLAACLPKTEWPKPPQPQPQSPGPREDASRPAVRSAAPGLPSDWPEPPPPFHPGWPRRDPGTGPQTSCPPAIPLLKTTASCPPLWTAREATWPPLNST